MSSRTDAESALCDAITSCITCGDVAVVLTVRSVDGADALCFDVEGHQESVAVELVGPVNPGDHLLVHAGVAIERASAAGAFQS